MEKEIRHEQYKEVLFGKKQLWHGMNILRSEGHKIQSMHVNKISVSEFDSKRWIAEDGIQTLAYGYRKLVTDAGINITDADIDRLIELFTD